MALKTLTYTSRASLDLTAADLAEIHRVARELNGLDGITGLLAFDGTRFLQIVEGSAEAVDALVERLRRDHRHAGIEIRDAGPIERRSFPGWSMELVRVSAGYLRAREELASILPPQVGAPVRALIARMSDDLARSFEME